MKRIFRNRKGNALLMALLVLLVLGALGVAHVISSNTGIKQSQVLFKGIDANFLLEGIISQAENIIRREANDYAGQPEWFTTFRTTGIGADSGWKKVSLSGTNIKKLAAEVKAEISVQVRFLALKPFENSSGDNINFGIEKTGQLEFKAQAKIGDNYYHAHAAKDVKVVNPLALSHDGDYNGLNKYNMFVKYAGNEYQKECPHRGESGGFVRKHSVRYGNYMYNRYLDETGEPYTNDFYFINFVNNYDAGTNSGKIYLGFPQEMRNESGNKILIDLPRDSYGDYYKTEKEKQVYKLNPPGDLRYYKEIKGKKRTIYNAKIINDEKDFAIIKSLLGKTVLLDNYKKLYDGGIKKADNASTPGSEQAEKVGAGEWLKVSQPAVVYKTIDGWEYTTAPWSQVLVSDSVGKAYKTDGRFNIKSPDDWENYNYMSFAPLRYDRDVIVESVKKIFESDKDKILESYKNADSSEQKNINPASPFFIGSTYVSYFLKNSTDKVFYNSYAHSSFVTEDEIDGPRGNPILWLNGDMRKTPNLTQIEGKVYGRYMEGFYLKSKKSSEGEISYETPDQDISDLDSTEVQEITMTLPDVEPLPPEDRYKGLIETSVEGPVLRYNKADDYNTVARMVPFNKDGLVNESATVATLNGIKDPDYGNIYLDKVTSVFTDYIEFSHHNVQISGSTMIIYLNGVYLINSGFPMPIDNSIKEIKYVGKGAILVSGDIKVSCNLTKMSENDMLILASIGAFDKDGLKTTRLIVSSGNDDTPLNIEAGLFSMNRDNYKSGIRAGLSKPCFISLGYGTNIKGYWHSDWLWYIPEGTQANPNEKLRGTNLIYDTRFSNDSASDVNLFAADIALPYAFWKIWKNKDSEI